MFSSGFLRQIAEIGVFDCGRRLLADCRGISTVVETASQFAGISSLAMLVCPFYVVFMAHIISYALIVRLCYRARIFMFQRTLSCNGSPLSDIIAA
jgi:hypothetical protein